MKYEDLLTRLGGFNQEHLLSFWPKLSDAERRELNDDISRLDFHELREFFQRATRELEQNDSGELQIKPIPDSKSIVLSELAVETWRNYEMEGLRQISQGHVAVLLMAGGQGTRLGFAHPKGMYDVGLPSGKSLFQIQAERIRTLQRLAYDATGQEGRIGWYIMTSEHTMEPTRAYFEERNYFGLQKEDVVFFEQGCLPCFDFEGRILLDAQCRVAKAPDGNGGIYRALRDNHILKDFQRRGITYVHAHSVDNILIKVADPLFVGCCALKNADCGVKVVEKVAPSEAVGVVCIVDEKYQVVEYSELPKRTAEMRRSDGKLTFNAGNICNHMFSVDFLEKVCVNYERQLKLHVAKKKIPFVVIGGDGERVTPEKPNGIKIEKFVFDVFQFAENFLTVQVCRDEEFSALKNPNSAGKDCPDTVRADIFRLHRKYVETAGGRVEGDVCEISSLLSYRGEGIGGQVKGKLLKSPVYLKSSMENLVGHL